MVSEVVSVHPVEAVHPVVEEVHPVVIAPHVISSPALHVATHASTVATPNPANTGPDAVDNIAAGLFVVLLITIMVAAFLSMRK